MKKETCPVGRIHPDHQEFAVGEVDDVHHAKDDGQAKGDQGEEEAHQDSLQDRIQNNHKFNPKMSNAKFTRSDEPKVNQ
jgi:hypothetical protein